MNLAPHFDGLVFDKTLYEEMREYQKWQRIWLNKYGTLDLFDEWFAIYQEADYAILTNRAFPKRKAAIPSGHNRRSADAGAEGPVGGTSVAGQRDT